MSFRALTGFRDFYPEEMALRRHIEQAWHAAARAAGFLEIDGPPLESLDLLRAKSGDEIVAQLYAFTDKGDREVALRAELTPTLARMIAERAASLPKPIKWYAVPQIFRYERPQRGRLREHFQWNVDIVGSDEAASDAELLSVALDALRRLGLDETQIYVRVNHRGIVERKLRETISDDAEVERTLRLIDKGELTAENASKDLLQWFDEPLEGEEELEGFLAACSDFGIADYIQPDKSIVRGLAYYTGIVFEIFDRDRTMRAVAGGGRYDHLTQRIGGPSLPATGFGMGDVVLGDLLRDSGLLPLRGPRLDAYVVPIGAEMAAASRRVVRLLRDAGLRAEAPYAPVKVGKALRAADASGAKHAYLVGPDEWAEGSVRVRDLTLQTERVVRLEALP